MIYLYVKTHNITKLKYFGQTTAKDPFKYKGSGTYWKNHIRKHGYNVTTTIIGEFKDREECRKVALEFSIKNDIVKSKEWANLKVECLDGGWDHCNTKEFRETLPTRTKEQNPMYGKSHSPKTKEKISEAKTGKKLGNQSEKHIENKRKARCKKYKITSPSGEVIITHDLVEFCKQNSLPYKTMSKRQHKKKAPTRGACVGWYCEFID